MTPGVYNFKPQYNGNTFNGVQMTLSNTSDDVDTPIDLTGASIEMQLKKNRNSSASLVLSVNNGITLVSPEDGVIQIDKFLVGLDATRYLYDLKVTFSNGDVFTYLTGTFEVKQSAI